MNINAQHFLPFFPDGSSTNGGVAVSNHDVTGNKKNLAVANNNNTIGNNNHMVVDPKHKNNSIGSNQNDVIGNRNIKPSHNSSTKQITCVISAMKSDGLRKLAGPADSCNYDWNNTNNLKNSSTNQQPTILTTNKVFDASLLTAASSAGNLSIKELKLRDQLARKQRVANHQSRLGELSSRVGDDVIVAVANGNGDYYRQPTADQHSNSDSHHLNNSCDINQLFPDHQLTSNKKNVAAAAIINMSHQNCNINNNNESNSIKLNVPFPKKKPADLTKIVESADGLVTKTTTTADTPIFGAPVKILPCEMDETQRLIKQTLGDFNDFKPVLEKLFATAVSADNAAGIKRKKFNGIAMATTKDGFKTSDHIKNSVSSDFIVKTKGGNVKTAESTVTMATTELNKNSTATLISGFKTAVDKSVTVATKEDNLKCNIQDNDAKKGKNQNDINRHLLFKQIPPKPIFPCIIEKLFVLPPIIPKICPPENKKVINASISGKNDHKNNLINKINNNNEKINIPKKINSESAISSVINNESDKKSAVPNDKICHLTNNENSESAVSKIKNLTKNGIGESAVSNSDSFGRNVGGDWSLSNFLNVANSINNDEMNSTTINDGINTIDDPINISKNEKSYVIINDDKNIVRAKKRPFQSEMEIVNGTFDVTTTNINKEIIDNYVDINNKNNNPINFENKANDEHNLESSTNSFHKINFDKTTYHKQHGSTSKHFKHSKKHEKKKGAKKSQRKLQTNNKKDKYQLITVMPSTLPVRLHLTLVKKIPILPYLYNARQQHSSVVTQNQLSRSAADFSNTSAVPTTLSSSIVQYGLDHLNRIGVRYNTSNIHNPMNNVTINNEQNSYITNNDNYVTNNINISNNNSNERYLLSRRTQQPNQNQRQILNSNLNLDYTYAHNTNQNINSSLLINNVPNNNGINVTTNDEFNVTRYNNQNTYVRNNDEFSVTNNGIGLVNHEEFNVRNIEEINVTNYNNQNTSYMRNNQEIRATNNEISQSASILSQNETNVLYEIPWANHTNGNSKSTNVMWLPAANPIKEWWSRVGLPPDDLPHVTYNQLYRVAKKLKRTADVEICRTKRTLIYIDAITYFILSADFMEHHVGDDSRALTIYSDTLKLCLHIQERIEKSPPSNIKNSKEEITQYFCLYIICFEIQSFLHYKIWKNRLKEVCEIHKMFATFAQSPDGFPKNSNLLNMIKLFTPFPEYPKHLTSNNFQQNSSNNIINKNITEAKTQLSRAADFSDVTMATPNVLQQNMETYVKTMQHLSSHHSFKQLVQDLKKNLLTFQNQASNVSHNVLENSSSAKKINENDFNFFENNQNFQNTAWEIALKIKNALYNQLIYKVPNHTIYQELLLCNKT